MTKYAGREIFLPLILTRWLFATGVGSRFVLDYEHTSGEGMAPEEEFCDVSRRN
ncbi:MAG TPA: hypothetical protein VGO68_17275 [Pyrinomonadaceae bacterium]|nr:hypothetical protein [Pyrinomonadaceae bacterium]